MDKRSRMNHLRGWGFTGPSISGNPMLKQLAGSGVLGPSASIPEHMGTVMLNGSITERKVLLADARAAATSMGYHGHPWAVIPPSMSSAQTSQEDLDNKVKGMHNVHESPPQEGDNDNNDTKPAKKRKPRSSKASNSHDNTDESTVKTKKPRKKNSVTTNKEGASFSRGNKILDIVVNGETYDILTIPAPVCSCTGVPHQCYKWGVGGWQSSCCTKTMSVYPLPLSNTRPGARITGRKMSNGAYRKVLEKVAVEGHDLSTSVDLKDYWAKHGTNKFVTIR